MTLHHRIVDDPGVHPETAPYNHDNAVKGLISQSILCVVIPWTAALIVVLGWLVGAW